MKVQIESDRIPDPLFCCECPFVRKEWYQKRAICPLLGRRVNVNLSTGRDAECPVKRIDYPATQRCKRCGGRLSEIRTDGKTRWRHCYSCHAEFQEED